MLGSPSQATRMPLKAPITMPVPTAARTATPSGMPAAATRPATTAHMLNCAPIEMSIWRVMTTSVMPIAATSAGICEVKRESNGWSSKKFGAKMASATSSRPRAAATVISREYLPFMRPPFRTGRARRPSRHGHRRRPEVRRSPYLRASPRCGRSSRALRAGRWKS